MNDNLIEIVKQAINHPDGERRLAQRLADLHGVGYVIVSTNLIMVASNLTAVVILSNSKQYKG